MNKIDPWVGNTLKKYRKSKGLAQEEFGQAVSKKIELQFGRQEKGLSKSTISRIEKGTFIPPQNKLEIMLELLDIQNPQERFRIFEMCGYSPPTLNITKEKTAHNLQTSVEQNPTDVWGWLALISFLNQERQFHQSLGAIEKAKMAIDTSQAIYHFLLEAKQSQTFYLLEENKLHLDACLNVLNEAEALLGEFKAVQVSTLKLKAEIFKSRVSILFKHFYQVLLKVEDQNSRQSCELLYQQTCKYIRGYEDIHFSLPESERDVADFLYIEREKTSLDFKWLEYQEMKYLKSELELTWPELSGLKVQLSQIPVYIYGHLFSVSRYHQAKAKTLLSGSLGFLSQEDVLKPSALKKQWNQVFDEMHIFLENHQPLMQEHVSPDNLPRIPILNTSLLYVLVMARLGKTQSDNGMLFLNTLYFLSNKNSLSTWHYVAACFYAFRYIKTKSNDDIDKMVAHWMGWSQSYIDSPTLYNEPKFNNFLHEPVLWSVFLTLYIEHPEDKSPYLRWLFPKMLKSFEHEVLTIKNESDFFF